MAIPLDALGDARRLLSLDNRFELFIKIASCVHFFSFLPAVLLVTTQHVPVAASCAA
jgi:hypothetical protein